MNLNTKLKILIDRLNPEQIKSFQLSNKNKQVQGIAKNTDVKSIDIKLKDVDNNDVDCKITKRLDSFELSVKNDDEDNVTNNYKNDKDSSLSAKRSVDEILAMPDSIPSKHSSSLKTTFNGFNYLKYSYKGGATYYKCCSKKCPGRGILVGDYFTPTHDHRAICKATNGSPKTSASVTRSADEYNYFRNIRLRKRVSQLLEVNSNKLDPQSQLMPIKQESPIRNERLNLRAFTQNCKRSKKYEAFKDFVINEEEDEVGVDDDDSPDFLGDTGDFLRKRGRKYMKPFIRRINSVTEDKTENKIDPFSWKNQVAVQKDYITKIRSMMNNAMTQQFLSSPSPFDKDESNGTNTSKAVYVLPKLEWKDTRNKNPLSALGSIVNGVPIRDSTTFFGPPAISNPAPTVPRASNQPPAILYTTPTYKSPKTNPLSHLFSIARKPSLKHEGRTFVVITDPSLPINQNNNLYKCDYPGCEAQGLGQEHMFNIVKPHSAECQKVYRAREKMKKEKYYKDTSLHVKPTDLKNNLIQDLIGVVRNIDYNVSMTSSNTATLKAGCMMSNTSAQSIYVNEPSLNGLNSETLASKIASILNAPIRLGPEYQDLGDDWVDIDALTYGSPNYLTTQTGKTIPFFDGYMYRKLNKDGSLTLCTCRKASCTGKGFIDADGFFTVTSGHRHDRLDLNQAQTLLDDQVLQNARARKQIKLARNHRGEPINPHDPNATFEDPELSFIPSLIGSLMPYYKGYLYVANQKLSGMTYLRCRRNHCPSRAMITPQGAFKFSQHAKPHNHEPDRHDYLALETRQKIREALLAQPEKHPRQVYCQVIGQRILEIEADEIQELQRMKELRRKYDINLGDMAPDDTDTVCEDVTQKYYKAFPTYNALERFITRITKAGKQNNAGGSSLNDTFVNEMIL
ncbi:unnamed protein product [Gordionus sp. m RMFG-2023]|uniref:uncharacterized protein LOC135926161 isoform X2 n=1 Tax=Gordionus sp. m RMFG-2023 TaxID=3053472 RepID=UPI0030E30361